MSTTRSDGNGGLYIHRTSIEKWVLGIVAGVMVVVIAAGILGVFANVFTTRDNSQALRALASKLDLFVTTSEKNRDEDAVKHESLRIDVNSLKKRLTRIDHKLE